MKTSFILGTLLIGLTACGIRGRPQPPLTPPLLGRGEPAFSEATQEINLKKRKPKKIEGDFEDQKDFEDKGEE